MRRFVIAIVLLVLAAFIVLSRSAEIEQVAETLRRGKLYWMIPALLVQLVWLACVGLMYKAIYRLLGMHTSTRVLMILAVTANFVNTVAPSVGAGGMAIFIADARRRQLSTARVTIAGVLGVLLDYFSFLLVLALGLVVLFRRNHLTVVELTASGVLLLAALGLSGLLALGAASPPAFERVLILGARGVNRALRPLLRRDYLSVARAHTFATEVGEGLAALRIHPRRYLAPALLSLLGKALLVTILMLVFLAFGVPFSAGTIIAGFSIGYLFTIVSPTPAGIGAAEGAMTLALTTLRVPLGTATLITLAYRGLTFWLPFGYGFLTMRLLERHWRQHALQREIAP